MSDPWVCPSCGCQSRMTQLSAVHGKISNCSGCGTRVVMPVEAPPVSPPSPASTQPRSVGRPRLSIPTPPTTSEPTKVTARSTIASAKREAKALRSHVKALKKALTSAETELEKLNRLLDAADSRPRAVVRPIRTAR